jgi:predicted naringenin-chalcone synthase
MGCYAAVPAVRIARGLLAATPQPGASARVDVVHTELCSLHLDLTQHTPEQLVIQSLFADGAIRYALVRGDPPAEGGLRVLALREAIVADSADSMRWVPSGAGMQMSLARDVPERIRGAIVPFVRDLLRDAGLDFGAERARAAFAVHPGGPRIIDLVAGALELAPSQVAASRRVLLEHGNMSSATLPHVWMDLVRDADVAPGTVVVSLAFGPGLTVCGALFRKE